MRRTFANTLVLISSSLLLAGCYSYKPIPTAVDKDDFTQLENVDKQTIPEDCHELTLEMAQEIAKNNNPNFIATKHAMEAAWARFYQSLSAYFPEIAATYDLGMDYNYPRYQNPGPKPQRSESFTNQVGLSGQYLIFDGLMRTMNMLATRYEAKQSESQLEDAHRLLVKSVSDTYNSILLARENMKISKANLDFNRTLQKETEIKYEAGAVALTDVLNFRILATEAENGLILSEYNMRTAKYALAELMGLTNGDVPDYVGFPSIEKIEADLLSDISIYLDTALQNRQDLRAYRQGLQSQKYQLYQAWGRFSPTVTFNMDGYYQWNKTRYRGNSGFTQPYNSYSRTQTFDYGLTVDWMIFEGGRRWAQVRETQALVAQSEYLLEEQWLKVISEVRSAYDECVKSARQLVLFREIQGASIKNRDLVEEEYKAGNTDITRLNQAQTDLIQAQSNLATARINVRNARANLKAAIGGVD